MRLRSGVRIGPYEIVAPLGAGGMGEVYRATDTRLGREVAIKVLSERMGSRPDLKARFEREARAISLLNHPHICMLFDIGESGAGDEAMEYIVMELVEGESLSDRLARGPIALDHALRYGMQIADALDRAHRRGIVHRDLKPGNIMITKGGVKLLDFGLAKLIATEGVVSTSAATMNAATAEGHVVGTLQYMAPEQLEGRDVDARADIFSFGAVLYEMITGRRAFRANSQASLIAAILQEQPPPVSQVQVLTPKSLDRLVATCLSKDPEDRWQNARDVMLELRALAQAPPDSKETNRVVRWPWLAGAAVLTLGLTAAVLWIRRNAPTPASSGSRMDVSVNLPTPITLLPNGFGSSFAISPDGSKVAWVGERDGEEALYFRTIDSPEVTRIAGTEGAHAVFFSPDGQSVGFFSIGQLEVTSLRSSVPTAIAETGPGGGAVWLPDGTIVFSSFPGAPLMRVSSRGGALTRVTTVDTASGEAGHSWPNALPDGKTILYTVEIEGRPWAEARIVAQSLQSGKKKTIIEGGTNAVFVEPGYLFYYRGGTVLAVRFDPDKLQVEGEPVVIVPNVIRQPGTGGAFFRAALSGTTLYCPGGEDFFATQVEVVNRSGQRRVLPLPTKTYSHPRLSNDQTRLALQVVAANDDIWIYHRERDLVTRLTSKDENLFPVWSPDDQRLAVSQIDENGLLTIRILRTDASERPVQLMKSSRGTIPASWSGDQIAFQEFGGSSGFDLSIIRSDGTGRRTLLQTPFNETEPMFSPDGRWIAYAGTESGVWQVYVRATTGDAEKIQVSTSGGREPVWHRGGKELFYKSGNAIMSVSIEQTTPLRLSKSRKLLEGDFVAAEMAANYAVNNDGSEFFVVTRHAAPSTSTLHMVINPFGAPAK